MLTIIIGIILAGGIFCICYFFLIDSDYEEFALPGFAISFLLLVISLILGLFVPIQGFDEKTLEKETSLVVFQIIKILMTMEYICIHFMMIHICINI